MPQAPSLFLRQHDNLDGFLGEALVDVKRTRFVSLRGDSIAPRASRRREKNASSHRHRPIAPREDVPRTSRRSAASACATRLGSRLAHRTAAPSRSPPRSSRARIPTHTRASARSPAPRRRSAHPRRHVRRRSDRTRRRSTWTTPASSFAVDRVRTPLHPCARASAVTCVDLGGRRLATGCAPVARASTRPRAPRRRRARYLPGGDVVGTTARRRRTPRPSSAIAGDDAGGINHG